MSRRAVVKTTPHNPTGVFTAPPMPDVLACVCGAPLRCVSNNASTSNHLDWTVVDEQGRGWIDVTPTFRYQMADGGIVEINMHDADAWDRLAKIDIGKYSMLKVAYDTGFPFSHVHREDTSKTERPVLEVDPPRCHGMWMWAAPDGWRCRATIGEPALVPYS